MSTEPFFRQFYRLRYLMNKTELFVGCWISLYKNECEWVQAVAPKTSFYDNCPPPHLPPLGELGAHNSAASVTDIPPNITQLAAHIFQSQSLRYQKLCDAWWCQKSPHYLTVPNACYFLTLLKVINKCLPLNGWLTMIKTLCHNFVSVINLSSRRTAWIETNKIYFGHSIT